MSSATGEGEKSSSSTSAHPCRLFSLAEIQSATSNFDDELVVGKGGFGKVYKGRISSEEDGHFVAIKRLDSMSSQGEHEFRAEIDMLSKLRHCHLVSLIGFCHENKEMILVYEFMPNGSLYHHLHNADTPLSWMTRLKIAVGAARGMDYLHTGVGTQHGVIHRDVKSANILLNENWAAMISDFGLSKIGPTNQTISFVDATIKGTYGYLDPQYFYTRKLTRKTDVYAFGVVLFELLSGRLAVDEQNEEEEYSLVCWAQKCVKEKKFEQMVDSKIKGTISIKCLRRFAQIANRCGHSVPKERPTMTEVVASLQALVELQEKSNHSGESSGIMGFTWKMHKYFVSSTKSNSDQSETSSPKSLENNMNKEEEFATSNFGNDKFLDQSGISSPNNLDNNMNQHEESVNRGSLEVTHYGGGHYTKAYKGWVDRTTYSPCKENNGLPIAVIVRHDYINFDSLKVWKAFCHPNLVKLTGLCFKCENPILVYEFMLKGNFEDLIHSGVVARLPLVTKVKIVVGMARGIVFLQKQQFNNTCLQVSQSRLDRRNILLDQNFNPKLLALRGDPFCGPVSDIDGMDIVLHCNLSGYQMVFMEVLTGERIRSFDRVKNINCSFSEYGKVPLDSIAQLCFETCNEVDSESKMLTMLKEHDELIRERLK